MHSNEAQKLSFAEKIAIGSATGAATACVVEPIIYLKNKLQQGKHLSVNPRMWYRGLGVNAAGGIPTIAVKNSVYKQTEEYLNECQMSDTHKKLLAMFAAGIASSAVTCPRELLIVQQQNNPGNAYTVAKKIMALHGSSALLRGFAPIAARNCSYTGFFFIATPALTQEIREHTDNKFVQTFAPSVIAGSLSAILTHPLDTIKTCMQADLANKSIKNVAQDIYDGVKAGGAQKGGITAFYRGVIARIVGVAISMTSEYQCMNFFTRKYQEFSA